MATIVFFHAHPDDECIATGGSMARYTAEGHKVICVTATGGELGEEPEDGLPEGTTLAELRAAELHAACEILGVAEGRFLGYHDSGMADTEANNDPNCFWQADVEEAAERLAGWLKDWDADLLVAYDENGNYGHPDHIQVHRVGLLAAEKAGINEVYMATINRDHIRALIAQAEDFGVAVEERLENAEDFNIGMPAELITTTVDVTGYIGQKRKALACHRSQVTDSSFFLAMPEAAFQAAFGTEWYIKVGAPASLEETALV